MIDRNNLVPCAVHASLTLRRDRAAVSAAEGRETAAGILLPSNPSLALSGGHRQSSTQQATNWYATLSQEVSIAGQRRARLEAARSQKNAQEQGALATSRAVAAQAWNAYFEVLAARQALDNATRVEQLVSQASQAAAAAAARGVVSGVEADVADLTLVRLTQQRMEAQRRMNTARATLASLLGRDPRDVQITGELTPLRSVQATFSERLEPALDARPEVLGAREWQRVHEHTTDALERARVPNLTFSFIAQRDGFNERVLGGGLSLPIPLPAPLGHTNMGELAESRALTRQAEAVVDVARRLVRLELVSAREAYEAARQQSELFTSERIARAEQSLASITQEIAAGRLSISTSIVAQQALTDVLRARIDAQLALCLTSVELVRAAGLPLDGAEL